MAYIITGTDNIAKAVGRTPRTVYRWIKNHGFPAAKDPSGHRITTYGLIDQWVFARQKVERQHKFDYSDEE